MTTAHFVAGLSIFGSPKIWLQRSSSRLRSNRIETTTLKGHLDTPAHAGYSMTFLLVTTLVHSNQIKTKIL